MAAEVNKKFVLILAAGLMLAAGGVGALYFKGGRSAEQSMSMGDAAANKGDWEEAIQRYGNAVNREKTNTIYLEKYADAMSKSTPKTQQAYQERLVGQYFRTLESLATLRRTDVEAHKRLMGLRLTEFRRAVKDASEWNALITTYERAYALFPEGDPNVDKLKRFRGLTRVSMMQLNLDTKPADIEQATSDLKIAIKLDPTDEESVCGLAWLSIAEADRARVKGNEVGAKQGYDAAEALLTEFISKNPPAAEANQLLAQMKIQNMVRKDAGATPPSQLATQAIPMALPAVEAVLASDPKKLTNRVVNGAVNVYLMTRAPDSFEKMTELYGHALKARATDPELLLTRAEIASSLGKHKEAAAFFEELSKTPDLPLSSEGAMLFTLRPRAVGRQTEAMLAVWEQTKEAEEKAKIMQKIKSLREEYALKSGGTDPLLVMIDAKIAIANNDTTETRRLLDKYNGLTNEKDPQGMVMLAQVMVQSGNLGAARQQLNKIVENRRATPPVLNMLMRVEAQLGNYNTALGLCEQLLASDPQNVELKQARRALQDISRGVNSDDPWIRDYVKLEQIALQIAPNIDEAKALAIKLADSAGKHPDKNTALGRLRQMIVKLGQLNEIDRALVLIDQVIALDPNDETAKRMRDTMKSADPLAETVNQIQKSNLPETDKKLQIAALYEQVGKREEASKLFEEAQKLDPKNPRIVLVAFENAINRRDLEKAKELAAIGAAVNADGLKGESFAIRVLGITPTEEAMREAVKRAQKLTEIDKLSPLAWKLAGEAYMREGSMDLARNALTRALQIRPVDAKAATLLARAMVVSGAGVEALRDARERRQAVGGDPEFAGELLNLEFNFGERESAIKQRQLIFNNDPGNLLNTATLAEWYVRLKRVDEAQKPLAKLREVKAPGVEVLEAANALAKNDKAGALAKLDEYLQINADAAKGGRGYIVFAEGLSGFGYGDFGVDVLEKGRSAQDPETMDVDRRIGDLLFTRGDFEKAIEAYERVLASVKEDKDQLVLKRIVEANLRLGKFREALDKLAGVRSNDALAYQFHLLSSEAHVGLGDTVKARASLDAAVKSSPQNAVVFYKRAQLNVQDERFVKDAEQDLKECLTLNKRFLPARQLLASVYARQGNTDRMLNLMREGVKDDPSNDEGRALLVRAYLKLGKFNEATALVNEAVEESKGDPRWRMIAADTFRQQNDVPREVEQLKKVWEAVKTPQVAMMTVDAMLRLSSPDFDGARGVLAAPESMTDQNGPLLMQKARLATMEGRPAEADAAAKLAMTKLNASNIFDCGRFADDLSRALGGNAAAVRFINANPPQGGITEALKFHTLRLRAADPADRDAAVADLSKFAETTSDVEIKKAVFTALGEVNYGKKDYEQSAQWFRKSLDLQPDNAAMANNVAFILSKYLNRPSEALPLAEKAAAAAKDNASFADTLGTVYMKLQQWEKAEAAFQRSRGIAQDGLDRTPATLHLAELKLERGERSAAEGLISDVRRWAEEDPRIKAAHGTDLEALAQRARRGM